jgi:predicted nucleic acid-binding protein
LQAILYLDTNFLVGCATGRSPKAFALLTEPIGPIRLAIPSVCFMEAFSVLNHEEKSFRDFRRIVEVQIHEAKRNITFPDFPSSLVRHLEASLIDRERTFDLYEGLLYTAINGLCLSGEVIESGWEIVYESLRISVLVEDPTDNLILTTILHHARSHPTVPKAFLSENSKDFEKVEAKKALELAGVKYFRDAGNCMGWLNAQIGP